MRWPVANDRAAPMVNINDNMAWAMVVWEVIMVNGFVLLFRIMGSSCSMLPRTCGVRKI